MSDFNWIPDFGGRVETTPRTGDVALGDGYTQTMPDGLNILDKRITITFVRPVAELAPIEAYLESMAAKTFTWTPLNYGTEIRVIAKKWMRTYSKPGWDQLDIELERRYA